MLLFSLLLLGGLNNINEADECFDWACNQGKVRRSDSYVLVDRHSLEKEIAQRYNRNYRDYKIVPGKHHYYAIDSNGKEIYNSAGFGYGH